MPKKDSDQDPVILHNTIGEEKSLLSDNDTEVAVCLRQRLQELYQRETGRELKRMVLGRRVENGSPYYLYISTPDRNELQFLKPFGLTYSDLGTDTYELPVRDTIVAHAIRLGFRKLKAVVQVEKKVHLYVNKGVTLGAVRKHCRDNILTDFEEQEKTIKLSLAPSS